MNTWWSAVQSVALLWTGCFYVGWCIARFSKQYPRVLDGALYFGILGLLVTSWWWYAEWGVVLGLGRGRTGSFWGMIWAISHPMLLFVILGRSRGWVAPLKK